MNKLFYLAAALTLSAAAASCQKSIEQSQDQPVGEYRQVIIKAGASQTKISVSGGTLTWSANDKLNIVPQSGSVASAALGIKSGAGTASGTFEGQVDKSITDDTNLYGWCGGSWTYSSGSFSVDMPASQTYVANGLAENAYPSIGTGSIKNGISLSNPMGVLILTVKGASSDLVKSISVTSAANNLAGAFTVNPASSYAVSGGSSKTVTLNVASPYVALSSTGVKFYIVVPSATYAASDLTVKITFSNDEFLSNTFSDAVTVTANNATAKEITVSDDHTGRHGILNGQEYVIIKAKYDGKNDSYLKWATQNLAVTESGKIKWKSTNYIIGDFFQWAASYAGYGITADADKIPANLVIYNSFKNKSKGDTENSISSKEGKTFANASAPYYNSTSFTKYTSGSAILDPTDDVAHIVLGSTWRMPTGGSNGEFKAMKAATYWAYDATDKGYYVFKPGVGTSGAANGSDTIAGTDDKTKALLFFPAAAGCGSNTGFTNVNISSYYWSSTLDSGTTSKSYYLYLGPTKVDLENSYFRYYGFSVRPVSD